MQFGPFQYEKKFQPGSFGGGAAELDKAQNTGWSFDPQSYLKDRMNDRLSPYIGQGSITDGDLWKGAFSGMFSQTPQQQTPQPMPQPMTQGQQSSPLLRFLRGFGGR
jgi:hypothetical protein